MTTYYMLIFVFLPIFTCCKHEIVLKIKTKQFWVCTQKSTNKWLSSSGLLETWALSSTNAALADTEKNTVSSEGFRIAVKNLRRT